MSGVNLNSNVSCAPVFSLENKTLTVSEEDLNIFEKSCCKKTKTDDGFCYIFDTDNNGINDISIFIKDGKVINRTFFNNETGNKMTEIEQLSDSETKTTFYDENCNVTKKVIRNKDTNKLINYTTYLYDEQGVQTGFIGYYDYSTK